MKKIIVPPIKIQGIKTKLVEWISLHVPNFSWRRIEPFMGSGVVGFNIVPKNAIFSDINPHTIKFYQEINNWNINHLMVRNFLEQEGEFLKEQGEKHYKYVRDRFNAEQSTLDFLFLNRSDFNGMIRFNKKWGFNVPFGKKPERFSKAYITKIVNQVRNLEVLMQQNNREFICRDFEEIIKIANSNDFLYCDPPYLWRNVDYFDSRSEADEIKLNTLLTDSVARFILSTRHSNTYRTNEYLSTVRWNFKILTKEHFYHLWGKKENRNAMKEAIVMNYEIVEVASVKKNSISIPKNVFVNESLFDPILEY